MITFEIVDEIPTTERKSTHKRVLIHGNGAYLGGFIRLPDGRQSPESRDPMFPFRWLARQYVRR